MKDFILLLGANQYLRERSLAGARKAFAGEIFIANKNALFEKKIAFLIKNLLVMRRIIKLL
ncbi:hypothetical protein [Campylobacter avium]|uniref:hypothetical protein n=1 Tax=Campylobacter avium TaxID=522485 RepID=UPI002353F5B1|nr:hypothetical protein [Campylobacter avium]